MKLPFLVLATLSLAVGPAVADPAQNGPWLVGTDMVTALKYAPGFKHWDYVNPDAPKGGLVRLNALGSFDTFNPILPEGEAADGLGLVYETLMGPALDESGSEYSLIADAVAFPPDISSATFRINPRAKWQDGEPVTPDDVKWSFEQLVKVNPNRQQYYQDVTKVDVTAPEQVTFYFSIDQQPGTAQHPQPDPRPAQALVGGNQRQRQTAQHRRIDARATHGLGTIQDEVVQLGLVYHLRTRSKLLGRERAVCDRDQ